MLLVRLEAAQSRGREEGWEQRPCWKVRAPFRSRHQAFVDLEVEAAKTLCLSASTSESLRDTEPSCLSLMALYNSPTIGVRFSLHFEILAVRGKEGTK